MMASMCMKESVQTGRSKACRGMLAQHAGARPAVLPAMQDIRDLRDRHLGELGLLADAARLDRLVELNVMRQVTNP